MKTIELTPTQAIDLLMTGHASAFVPQDFEIDAGDSVICLDRICRVRAVHDLQHSDEKRVYVFSGERVR